MHYCGYIMDSELFDDHSTVHYPKLDADSAQIRLVVLARGAPNSPIHCTYRVVSLDDENLSYETLSYVWKDEAGTAPVCVEGKAASVTRGLFGALEQLRLVDCERTLWIDAICINQSDSVEKTQQVDMMCRIYSQCRRCNIWLGPLGETSLADANLAIDTVAWVAGDIADTPAFLDDVSQRRRAAEAFATLLTRPWWMRIWTVQEVILPPRRFIYWGPCKLSWDLLDRASEAVMDDTHIKPPADLQKYAHEFYASGAFGHLTARVRSMRITVNEHPLYLFWRWRFRQATDPRDKIYALLGMRRDVRLPSVPSCDYTVDVRTLFRRVTVDLIELCNDLNPLIGRRGEPSNLADLPSWVVDWSGSVPGQGRSAFWEHQTRWTSRDYCADRGTFGVGDGLRFADEQTLLLAGLYVDKIAVVEQRQTWGEGQAEGFHEILLGGADRWGDLITRFQRSGAATGHAVELPGNWMQAFIGLITGRLVPGEPEDGDQYPDDWTVDMLRDQALFITETGRFGLGPLSARPGQQLWIVGGCRFPVILDTWPSGGAGEVGDSKSCRDFTWVSECFVYGTMKGEAVEGRGEEQVDIRLH
ncbi:hypothetical protein SLS63_007244 [Diaporthe eres]|uniref:Heterokaryon incompatibility domain-containing protein n=1 Tax=Diaporthe eres TaxID=83184 RepID=A0ABR1P5R7_DIAER